MAGTIKGITIEFRGDTTKFDQAIRKINNETKSLDSELKKVNNALKFNPSSVELWSQKQTLLKSKISETKEKLDTLKQAQAQMDASGVDKNSAEYRNLQREIIEAESKLKTFKKQLNDIGNVKLKALSEEFKNVGKKMTDMGKDLTTKVTLPLAAIGTVGVKKFAEVDKTMQLTNKTMQNSEAEAELLNKAMKKAASESTFGMNDAATATLNFARAGLSAEEAAEALAPAMNLAAGEGGNLDTVSAGLVATINGFGDTFDKAGDYADVFANACNNSALDIDSLADSMSIAAPIFSAAGYSVKDASLYLGVMADNGIDANKAATSLKTGLARLVSPAKQGAAMMDKLRFSVTNTDGSMKSSIQIQKELHDKFMDLSESEQIAAASAIFGKNQMAPWLALIRTSPDDVGELNTKLGETGTTSEMAQAMMSGFGGSLERIKSGLDVAATSLGEALAPTLQKVADLIQKLVDWFNKLSPKTKTFIATAGLIVAALGPVLVILGALSTGIGNIIGLVGKIGPMITGLKTGIGLLSSGSLLPIIAVIGLVVAAGIALYKNWDKIKAAAKAVKTAVVTAFDGLKTKVNNAIESVKNAVSNFKTAITTKWTEIKTKTGEIWAAIKEKITEPIKKAKETIADTLSKIKEKVGDVWTKVKETIENKASSIKEWMLYPFTWAKEKIQGAIDKIKDLFPISLGDFFGNIKLPHLSWDWEEIGDFVSIPVFSIDWYKKGGIFDSPTIAGIGEAGPEAVVPLDKFWAKLDNIAAGTGGDEITINVYASDGMDVNELALKVEQRLVQLQKQRVKAYGGI